MLIKLIVATLLFLLFGVSPALAVTVTISNIPSSITDEPFTFNVSVSGASAGTNYLRANFFPTGTTNYFGYTYNGTSYVNSSTCSDYLAISIDSSGNWSGTVQAKVDTSSSYYTGSGTYSFKVRRYTQSCSSSYLWSNETTTTVSISSPSPSPSPSPTPSPNSSISPSPSTSSSPSSSTTSSSAFTISNIPTQIDSTETFNPSVNLSLSDRANTTFYLKGAFKRKDGTNYFGLTKVGSSWIKNSAGFENQYKITTNDSGSWSGNLEIRPDIMDSGYEGAGEYIFKVGRYTEDGSLNWSNEAVVKINAQEIVLDNNSDILGVKETPDQQDTTKTSKQITDEYSLAKYIKVATPSSQASTSAKSNAKVQGAKQINYLSIMGGILAIIGVIPITYAVYHQFRRRNKAGS